MSTIVRKYPALSLLVLAMILGVIPLAAINAGRLPEDADQLAAFSPSLAAFILVLIEGRKGGVREWLGRFLIWRVGIQYWAYVLLFGIPTAVAALYLFNLFGGPAVTFNELGPLSSLIRLIIVLTVLAGFGEEGGWRGFAMPRLQARYNALVSSLMIGAAWGIWHIPLFLTRGTIQSKWMAEAGWLAVLGYALFCMAWSVQYTWIFNHTKGSVLLAAVMHGAVNALNGYIDVYRGHVGGIFAYMAVTMVVSTVVALLAGATHLSRAKERNVLGPESMAPVEAVNPVGA